MSRGKPSESARGESGSAAETTRELASLAQFFAQLVERAGRDPLLARELLAAVRASGLLALTLAAEPGESDSVGGHSAPRAGRATQRQPAEPSATQPEAPALDPFTVWRRQGEHELRELLAAQEVPALRQIIRTHRLDPARISARWTARDRLIALIVDQVRARTQHGRAFERV